MGSNECFFFLKKIMSLFLFDYKQMSSIETIKSFCFNRETFNQNTSKVKY